MGSRHFNFTIDMTSAGNVKKPSRIWLFTEGLRAFLEFIVCFFYRLFHRYKKVGDGHPILVIPGFMGSGLSTRILRKFIDRHGYHAYDWGPSPRPHLQESGRSHESGRLLQLGQFHAANPDANWERIA